MTQTAGTIAALDTLTARDLMKEGGESIDADASLREVVDRFLTGASRHLIVTDEDGYCLGVIGARHIAQYDIGQTVVVAEGACVAVEAMEGTDAAIERAGQIMKSLESDASTLSRALTVVKIAKPNQDMRFDVPVIGVKTIEVMQRAGATCLALDAGKCLLLDGDAIHSSADAASIAIVAS